MSFLFVTSVRISVKILHAWIRDALGILLMTGPVVEKFKAHVSKLCGVGSGLSVNISGHLINSAQPNRSMSTCFVPLCGIFRVLRAFLGSS